jgi:hypothetical protein
MRFAIVALLLFVAATLGACSSDEPACGTSADLVPRCGVLLGIATNPNTNDKLDDVERALDTRFRMVYRFHDLDDQIPTVEERELVRSGRILHVAIDSRIYQPPAHTVGWAAIARGGYDRALTADARGIASLKVPVFVTFDHEPDQPDESPGTPADFIAAWRHVHELFDRAGAQNAVWVWVVTGYPPYFASAGRLWPGNAYVDWISWEAYNRSGCTSGNPDATRFRTFAQSALPFYSWIKLHGPGLGIDIRKPMMISESGSVQYPTDPRLAPSWYRDIPLVLRQHPQIKAIGLWDRPGTGGCNYQFDDAPSIRTAITSIASSGTIHGETLF